MKNIKISIEKAFELLSPQPLTQEIREIIEKQFQIALPKGLKTIGEGFAYAMQNRPGGNE